MLSYDSVSLRAAASFKPTPMRNFSRFRRPRPARNEGHLPEFRQHPDHVRERHLLERQRRLHVRVQRRLAGQAVWQQQLVPWQLDP